MQAQVDLPEVAYGVGGKRLGFTFGLTQADLDALATPFIDRTLQVTQDALNIAHLSPSSFDSVVLVGGSTRMPLVARRVEAFFGVPVIDRVNPDEVVAVGAAVQAASLVDATRKRGIPSAPTPGVIGRPQRVQEERSSDVCATVSGLRARSGPRRRRWRPSRGTGTDGPGHQDAAPRRGPGCARPRRGARRERAGPALGEDRSLSTTASPSQADMDDHSNRHRAHDARRTGVGPQSMTNVLGAFPFGAPAAPPPAPAPSAARSDPATLASAKSPPRKSVPPPLPASPASASGSQFPGKPAATWGAMNPLETEDISRIVPDAMMARGAGAAPSVQPTELAGEQLTRAARRGRQAARDRGHLGLRPGAGQSRARARRRSDIPARPGAVRVPAVPAPPAAPAAAFPRAPEPAVFTPAAAPPPFQLPSFDAAPPPPPPAPFQFPPQRPGGPPPTPFVAPQVRNALPGPLPTDFSPPAGWEHAAAPVLVDVTPRALVVETVGGYCDTVIPRNAKIPCEHTRVFATGRDLQTVVHVRVGQGEEQRFSANQYLGELELSDLRPAPRGELTLSVIFELDADGSLLVRAIDATTGRQAHATMKLIAVAQSDEAIEEMIERSRSVSVTG